MTMSFSSLPVPSDYVATCEYVNDTNNQALQPYLQHHQMQDKYFDMMDHDGPEPPYRSAISLCNNDVSQCDDDEDDYHIGPVSDSCGASNSKQNSNSNLRPRNDAVVDQEFERLQFYNNKIDENTESLISIESCFFSENENEACTARRLYHLACMNDLVEKHYDHGLKPNTLHLAMEYIATILAQGRFAFKTGVKPQIQVLREHCNADCLFSLFVACKIDEGQAMPSRLFQDLPEANLNKPVATCSCGDCKYDNAAQHRIESEFKIDNQWLKKQECAFIVDKVQGDTIQSTRFEYLLHYLKRIGFQTNSCIAQEYRAVKRKCLTMQQNRDTNGRSMNGGSMDVDVEIAEMSEHESLANLYFCFLCRYICEMSYYKIDFLSYSKSDLAVGCILTAYIIAHRFPQKYRFVDILLPADVMRILGTDVVTDNNMFELVQQLIRVARAPNVCRQDCVNRSGVHHSQCDCVFHYELNTFLKYSKPAFGEVAQFGVLSTEKNIYSFRDLFVFEQNKLPHDF